MTTKPAHMSNPRLTDSPRSALVRLGPEGFKTCPSALGVRWGVRISRLAGWFGLAALPLSSAQAQQAPPETRTTSYTIQVKLLPERRLLMGNQVVEWRNATRKPARELWFHLYWNAWLNNRSTWLREDSLRSRPRSSLRNPRAGDWSYSQVESLKVEAGGPFLESERTSAMYFASPDDGNKDDRTVLVVPLERAVQPGETVRVSIGWKAKIPRTFARTGFRGNFFFIAHWFPKLGVFQADGSWNCHQFHAATEFFSDYGNYDVRMTVPTGWKVGATGVELGVIENSDGTSTHRYQQDNVHDFAWTTSSDYREARRRFDLTGLKSVDIRLLYQPEHQGQVDRHFKATEAALKYYGLWFGEYPYGHLTVVDPAWRSGARGMEYPTLYTCGTRYLNPPGGGSPEGVTIHEAGHQFWYGLVGNNEFEHAWLDEGINTFSTARVFEVAYGKKAHLSRFFQGFFPIMTPEIQSGRILNSRRHRYLAAARGEIQATPSYLYHPSTSGATSYTKTALWLLALERRLGWDVLKRILSTFFERSRFRHPTPEDFFRIANQVSPRDLSPFFEQVFHQDRVFDYSVESVSSLKVETKGYLDKDGQFLLLAEASDSQAAEEGSPLYETTVLFRRLGDGILPQDVLLRFEDGEEFRAQWDGRKPWKLYRLVKRSKLDYAAVDPDQTNPLDINFTNNSRRLQPQATLPATKWALKWLIWLQDYLQTVLVLL